MLLLIATGCLAAHSAAQTFVNGDFETGDMTGWTITVGPNAMYVFHEVLPFDMNGTDPGGVSRAAQFSVGQASNEPDVYRGISVTQDVALQAGQTYLVSYDWAAHNYFPFDNFDGGIFDLVIDGVAHDTHDVMNIFTEATEWGTLSAQFTATESRNYTIGSRITRRFMPPFPDLPEITLGQYLDNFEIEPVPEPATFGALTLGLLALAVRKKRH